MYKVYILQSLKTLRTYVGYTKNFDIRFKEHNSGKVLATRNYKPWKVLYIESCDSLKQAKLREKYWKSGGGRRKLKTYFQNGFPPIIS